MHKYRTMLRTWSIAGPSVDLSGQREGIIANGKKPYCDWAVTISIDFYQNFSKQEPHDQYISK